MPVPRKGETQKEFVPRCISYLVKEKPKMKHAQRVAVCINLFQRKKGEIKLTDYILGLLKMERPLIIAVALDQPHLAANVTKLEEAKHFMLFNPTTMGYKFRSNTCATLSQLLKILADQATVVIASDMTDVAKKEIRNTYLLAKGQAGRVLQLTKMMPPISKWNNPQLRTFLMLQDDVQLRTWLNKLKEWKATVDRNESQRRIYAVRDEMARRKLNVNLMEYL